LCSTKILSQEDSKFAKPVLQGGKNTFLHFKSYNLAIYVVNFLKLFHILELSVKSSKESTETVSLLKIGNKVVEVG
jgi:hypothetical protein